MKAISIKDPWAEMIASGQKTIETRTWKTKHRGEILIVKSLKPESFYNGMAVAIAEIEDCRPMTKEDEKNACCDIYPRANSWVLKNVRRVRPFPVKGKLNVYDVEVGISND